MIIKVTRGASASRGLAYDYGPGLKNEHAGARQIFGTVTGHDFKARGRWIDAHAARVKKESHGRPIYRFSLSNDGTKDRVLTDRDWRIISQDFLARFSGRDVCEMQCEVVRHDDHHVHVTLSRYSLGGELIVGAEKDYARAQTIARALEREYGLAPTIAVEKTRLNTREKHGRDQHTRVLKERIQRTLGSGGGLEQLSREGIEFETQKTADGLLRAIRFRLRGEDLWLKGSSLGWSAQKILDLNMGKNLGSERADATVSKAKNTWERKANRDRAQQMSRDHDFDFDR